MLATAVGVTGVLVAASLLTRVAHDPEEGALDAAADLVYKATQWRETAVQDTDPALRLQHAAFAMAYMHAARSIARDAALERRTGMNVARAGRAMDRRVLEARQNLRPDAASAGYVVAEE